MAVEIPVYVDIQGAFDRAVREIPQEIPKLEKVISQHALKMTVDVGSEKMSIRRILTDTTLSANDLERALRSIRRAFDDAVVKGAKNTRTSATVNNLAKAYGLLEQRIKGVYDSNTVAAMRLEDTIAKVSFKIQDLKTKLATLTPGTDQFSKSNYEMMLLQKRLGELTRQHTLYKAGVDASSKSLIAQSSIVRQLTGYFSGLYAVHTAIRFVKQIRDVTGELEYQRVALGHLLQDVSYGNELFDKIVEAAKQSPFRITQLVTYTKQLAAYRIEQENLYDTTMRLADISAGLGVDMNRLILAYGQVRAASVLRGQELRQFTEAGIPLVEELAKKFTKLKGEMVTTADVFKLISERAVPFEYIKEIFEELTDAGGMFYKMQEEQAKTLKGRWEKLKDAYDQALMSLGDSDTFQQWNDTVLAILNGVAKNLTKIVRIVNAASIGWVTYRIATSNVVKSTVALTGANLKATVSMIKMFGVAGTLRAGFVALQQAWKRFVAALSTNWVGIVLTAVSTLVTYFTTFGKKTKEVTEELNGMEKAIEKMKDANKEFEYGKGLIASYEELAKKTERSSKESERMLDTLNELERAFPRLTEKIDNDNLSLEERLQIMRDVVNASHDAAVEEAKNRLNAQKEIIRGLEDDAKAAKLEKESVDRRLQAAQTAEKIYWGEASEEERKQKESYSGAKSLKESTIELAKAAKVAAENYEKVSQELAVAKKEAEDLEGLIDPKKKTKDWYEWQKQIKTTQDSLLKFGDTPVFTDKEIQDFTSIYDLSKKLKKRIDDLTTSLKGMRSQLSNIADKDSDSYKALSGEIKATEKTLEMAEAIRIALGLAFGKGSSSSYTQDPFIKQMQERMKFMKDFQKGYEDLSKYLSKQSALGKESEFMLTRGLSLGLDAAEQKRAAEDLSNWYQGAIENAFKYLQDKKGVTGTWQEFLSRQITGNTNRDKMLRDFQSLMQSLFDAKTDFDVSQEKKNMEEALKKVTEELKRSETARNFYKNILDLTGDEQLAATMAVSVYGDEGEEFKERMQKQLEGALSEMKLRGPVSKDLEDAFKSMNFEKILAVKDLPAEVEKVVRQAYESVQKYNADAATSYTKLLLKFDEIEQQRINITKQAAKDRKDIEDGLALEIEGINKKYTDPAEIEKLVKAATDRANAVKAAVIRQEELDLSRLEKNYRLFFSSVGVISQKAARTVVNAQKKMLTDQFVGGEISFSKYTREINQLDQQLEKYASDNGVMWAYWKDGIQGAIDKTKEYANSLIALASTIKVGEGGVWTPDADTKDFLNRIDDVLNFGAFSRIFKKDKIATIEVKINVAAQKAYNDAISQGKSNAEAMEAASKAAGQAASEAGNEMAASASGFASGMAKFEMYFKQVASFIGFIGEELERTEAAGGSVEDWGWSLVALNEGLVNGFEKFKSGDFFGAMISVGRGIAEMINPTKVINNQIKEQDKLLEKLQYEYDRLSEAMEDSFGADYIYNYNKQLEILQSQADAYRKQAELERKKKNPAEDTAKGYEKSAREIEDRISDMRTQLSEFFSGTDLTSAAEDFASAWIEAYKEFGSTTDAMSEKFNNMIESMINRSLAAKIMQEMLQPIFDQIDTLSKDGLLSTAEIASIAALAQERIPMINEAMTNLMTSLASAGLDVRASTAGFKGISRDIAGASEESILGLAAAVNTQNYYISYIPQINENVAAILAAMTGGETGARRAHAAGDAEGEMLSVQEIVNYHIPDMHQQLINIASMLRSVITTKTNSTNTAYIAVK